MTVQAKGPICFNEICSAWKNMINALEVHRLNSLFSGVISSSSESPGRVLEASHPTQHTLRETSAPQSISDSWFVRGKHWGTPFVCFIGG